MCVPQQSRNLHNSGMELLKGGIPKMTTNSGITPITCSILELQSVQSWNVAHCWNFTLFPLLCDTFSDNSSYLMEAKMLSFFSWQFWRWAWFVLRKQWIALDKIALVLASVLLLWNLHDTDWLEHFKCYLVSASCRQLILLASSAHSSFNICKLSWFFLT